VVRVSNTTQNSRNRTVLWIGIAAVIAIAAIIVTLVLPQTAGGGHYSVVDRKVTITTVSIGKLGTVLATDQGYALYTYPPDAQHGVTCYDRCALNWPPVFLADGVTLVAGPDLEASLLRDVTDRNGKRVATYDGWPLYLYTGDVTPGTATGHGQYLDGGYWYVIRPSGEIVKPEPQR
jgi:predicted lipoprotein with Yx(FWY)xxD motif